MSAPAQRSAGGSSGRPEKCFRHSKRRTRMSNALAMIASVASLALGVNASAALAADAAKVKSVVLVHGGFVDGSGWQAVYHILKKDGYDVTIVQNPTTSLADDVAVTRRMLAEQDGPAILVGHSYGGVVL